jgi:methylenetetrahydrofolate reductase (NADPH)
MKIRDSIEGRNKAFSFELFPPKTEKGDKALLETIEKLSAFDPAYVSVTYGAGGSTRDRTISVVDSIKSDTPHIVMPHLTCIGSSKEEIIDIVEYYRSIGVENILALRGDPPMGVTEIPEIDDGFDYASDLIVFLRDSYNFSIGAAVYPEGHRESITIEADLQYTKEKVDSGADFLITQMFFDNRFFLSFLERCEALGINVPIIPGIMPITNLKRVRQLSLMCNASIPSSLNELIYKYENMPEDGRKAGIDYTTQQCRELWEHGVRYFHFYTLNQWQPSTEIINGFFQG